MKTLNFFNENKKENNEIIKFQIKESQQNFLGAFLDDNSDKVFDEKKVRLNFNAK